MKTKILFSLALLLTLSSSAVNAEDAVEVDLGGFDTEEVASDANDDLAGFGDDTDADIKESNLSADKKPSMWNVSGNVAFKTSFGYISHNVYADKSTSTGLPIDSVDYSGFNQAQVSTYLQLDAKLSDDWKLRISGDAFYDAIYDLHPNNPYNQDTLDAYQTQLRIDDTYVQGRLSSDVDVKIGRQIVVWGKSDSIRVTDVINPLDNRLPAMTDIEDLRLPTTMAKLDYYLGQWNFSAMAIIESRIFLQAAPRGEFFPVDNIFPVAPSPFLELVQPDSSFEDMQYAFAANGTFSGWDLSFYAADVLDSKWHLETTTTNVSTASRHVSKIQMLGTAINIATGSWLVKSEIAYISGIRYNSTKYAKDRLDFLVGFDYMGFKDTVLSLEVADRHIFNHENIMSVSNPASFDFLNEDEYTTAMRASRSFVNDTINATALVTMFGATWEYGGFARIWVEYEVMNAVNANVGLVDYIRGDRPFTAAISDNDRIFADITYNF